MTLKLTGRFHGVNHAILKLDSAPEGFFLVEGWIERKKRKGKMPASKLKYKKGMAWGEITFKAEETLLPGFKTSLVIYAEVKKGKETTRYSVPAIPVEVVKTRDN